MGWGIGDVLDKGRDIVGNTVGKPYGLDRGGSNGGAPSDRDWNINDLYDAIRLNDASGIGSEKKVLKRYKRAGGTFDENGNPVAPTGYDPASFDPATATSADRNRLSAELKGPYSRPSLYRKSFDEWRAEQAKAKMDEYKKNTLDPMLGSIDSKITDMMANPDFSPEELAANRSQLVSQAKTQETQRLRRVAATLGLSGMDPGSIAGAALVNSVAQETDQRITDAISQYTMQVKDMERSSNNAEIGIATDFSTRRTQLETALTQGNYEQLFGLSSDIGGILEALDARNAQLKAEKEAARLGFYGNLAGSGIQAIGSIGSSLAGGAAAL